VKRARILKILLIVIAASVLVITTGTAILIKFYPTEKILKLITTKAEAALGRKVSVKDIGYGFGGVVLTGVTVHESDENSPVLASVEKADLRISFLSLLKLELDFDSITLKQARCNIVFDDKGESNLGKLVSTLKGGGESGVTAKISKIRLIGANLTLSNPPSYLAPLAGGYEIDALVHIGKNIEVSDCSIRLPHPRGKVHPDLTIKILKDNFEISGKVKLENAAIPWVYQWGSNVTLPYNVANGMVRKLVITKSYVRGDVSATCTLLNSPKLVIADGYCKVDIDGRTVFIGRTQGAIEKSSFYIDGLHFTFDGKLISFNIRNIDARMADVMPLLKFIPPKIYGSVEGNLKNAAGLYNGNLVLNGCGYDPDTKIISDLNARISITNNMFKATGIPFNFYGNPCALSIASTESSLSKLFINVGAEKIVLDTEKIKISQSNDPVNIPVEINGIVNVAQLTYGQQRFSNIQLQYRLSGGTCAIKGFQFIFAEGRVSGDGNILLGKGAPTASLSIRVVNLAMQNAFAISDKMRNRFFGLVSGSAKIEFEVSSRILQTARGNAEFTLEKGKLVDTGIQNGLGLILSELKYKLRDMEFNKIYGNVDIRGITYLINSFIFNSNNVRLKINGTIDQKLVAAPLHINLEFTREFIQDLPGLITLGLNKYLKGEWYILPFIMSGDITDGKNVKWGK
jgi:hypothetical protein